MVNKDKKEFKVPEEVQDIVTKLAPYVIPALIALGLIVVLAYPIGILRGIPVPVQDVLKYDTMSPVGKSCDIYKQTEFEEPLRVAKLSEDHIVYWIGLEGNPDYPMYLSIIRSGLGYRYYVNLIRCDIPGTLFTVECVIKTFEGDEERIQFEQGQIIIRYIYTGRYPDKITAVCKAVV